jgi:polyisoprenoid-binding protein YceI
MVRTWRAARALAGLVAVVCAATSAAGAERPYTVDAEASRVTIQVGKGGLFGFAGHEHEVVAPEVTGEVIADVEDLARSSVTLLFTAGALRVTGRGEPAEDVPKVQEAMLGPKVLDVTRYPQIRFTSRTVSGKLAGPGVYELQVVGDMELHGVTKSLTLPLKVEMADDRLTASGRTVLRQKDFAMSPVSVAGVVKVKNEVGVDFVIVARPR